MHRELASVWRNSSFQGWGSKFVDLKDMKCKGELPGVAHNNYSYILNDFGINE